MCVWRMSLRRTKSTIISWAGSNHALKSWSRAPDARRWRTFQGRQDVLEQMSSKITTPWYSSSSVWRTNQDMTEHVKTTSSRLSHQSAPLCNNVFDILPPNKILLSLFLFVWILILIIAFNTSDADLSVAAIELTIFWCFLFTMMHRRLWYSDAA